MKKICRLLMPISATLLSGIAGAQSAPWTAGLRTGAFHESSTYREKNLITDKDRNVRSGFYHQAFLNRSLGKRQR